MGFREHKVFNGDHIKVADKLLKMFKSLGIEAIVAGGMPRDYLLNKQIRDVDVYIKHNDSNKDKIEALLDDLFDRDIINSKEGSVNYAETGIGEIVKVVRGNLKTGKKFTEFELIFTDTKLPLEDYVDTNFDLSICKAIYDGDRFYGLDDFNLTSYNKEVTFNTKLSLAQTKHSIKRHLNKIRLKFPEFKYSFLGTHNSSYGIKKVLNRSKLSDKMVKDYILKTDDSIFIGYTKDDNKWAFQF